MDKDNRHSLTIRIQARDGTPLSKVIYRLNSMSKENKRKEIINLLMASLPYAVENNQEEQGKIERCYWETQERLFYYNYLMKQTLSIESEPPNSKIFGAHIFWGDCSTSQVVEPESKPKAEPEELEEDLEPAFLTKIF